MPLPASKANAPGDIIEIVDLSTSAKISMLADGRMGRQQSGAERMNRNVILATVAAVIVGTAIGYFVMSSGGIVSKPGGGTMNTPQR